MHGNLKVKHFSCYISFRNNVGRVIFQQLVHMYFLYLFFFSVPSRAPSNITFKDVRATRVTVSWNPLPWQFHNGRLLGYKVYLRKNPYYSVQSNTSSVNFSNPNTTQITLTGLEPAQRYDVSVSAFTSKGEGPRSYNYYVTTGKPLKTEYNPVFLLIHSNFTFILEIAKKKGML